MDETFTCQGCGATMAASAQLTHSLRCGALGADGIRRRNAPRVPEEGSTTPAQQQLQPVPPPPPQPAPPAAAAADAATMPSAPQSRSDARRTAPQQHECATCTYVNEPGSSHCDMCGSVLGEGSLAAPAAPAAAAAAAAAADPGAAAGGNTDQQQQQQQRHHGDGGSTSSSAQPWPCPRCTFHNAPAAAACAMCGLPSSSAQGPGSSAQLPGSSAQLPGSSAQGPDGDDGDSVRPPDRTERTRLVQDDRVAEVMAARPSTGALAAAAAVAGGLMGGVGGGRMGALCGALMGGALGAAQGVIMDAEEQQRRSLCEGEQPVQTRTTTTRFPGGVTVRTFRSGGGSAVSEHDLHELLHMLESLMTADGHLPTDGEGRRSSVSQAALDALTDRVLSAEEVAKLPESQRSCCICLEEFRAGQGVKWLECLHCFHTTCIDAALQRRDECPICKHRVGGGGPPSPDSRPPPSTGNASRPRLF